MFFRNETYRVFVPIGAILGMSSCNVIDPPSPIASYIHIDSISVTTNYPTEGSSSHRITDAWVVYDNAYLGTFPLPADIPLIGEGNHSLTVKGGIMENGIAAVRSAYPKYIGMDTVLNLVARQTTTLTPVVKYLQGITFAQLEDFDDGSLSLESTSTVNAPLEITQTGDPNAFEQNSGKVTLTDTTPVFEVASSIPFILPLGTLTYLELNYKCDLDFSVGVYVLSSSGVLKLFLLNVRESSTWKKIYINVNDLGGVVTDGINYKIYLHANKPTGTSSAELYFDNLKVVY